jgi:hypothetical protein
MSTKKQKKKRKRYWNTTRPQVLVLNMGRIPINVFDWEEALVSWSNGRADILHTYENMRLRSGKSRITGEISVDMACPAVIMMVDCIPSSFNSSMVKTLPLNKKTVLDRDKGRCAYCGNELKLSDATIDHVYPKDLGGLNTWLNVRAACLRCNGKKDNKTLTELGWKLKTRLGVPTLTEEAPKSIVYSIGHRIPHESWRKYIKWAIETEEKVREHVDYVKWEK